MDSALPANICANWQKKGCNRNRRTWSTSQSAISPRHSKKFHKTSQRGSGAYRDVPFLNFWVCCELENVLARLTETFDSMCIPKKCCTQKCVSFGILQKKPYSPTMPQSLSQTIPDVRSSVLVNLSDPGDRKFFAHPMAFFLHGSKSMARTQGPLQMPRPSSRVWSLRSLHSHTLRVQCLELSSYCTQMVSKHGTLLSLLLLPT